MGGLQEESASTSQPAAMLEATESSAPPPSKQVAQHRELVRDVPFWVWVVLAIAIAGMSSGGVWFAALPSTPAIMKSSWRLNLTAFMQLPFFVYEWKRKTTAEVRAKSIASLKLLIFTGLVLGLHFAAWSISINETSLSHSLLFVCSSPILMIIWAFMVFLYARTVRSASTPLPPTLLETIGTLLGFAAAAVLALSAGSGEAAESAAEEGVGGSTRAVGVVAPTLRGDLWALLGAATVVFYLKVGSSMRTFMPLFVYAFPVTASAGLSCLFAAVILEKDSTFGGFGPGAMLGFLGSWPRFGLTFGAAMAAGILGHTGANLCLEYVSPLVISINLLFEPFLGSLMGYFAGLEGEPDIVTLLCGPVLMAAAVIVTLGDRKLQYSQRLWDKVNDCMPICGMAAKQLGLLPPPGNAAGDTADLAGMKASADQPDERSFAGWHYHDPSSVSPSPRMGQRPHGQDHLFAISTIDIDSALDNARQSQVEVAVPAMALGSTSGGGKDAEAEDQNLI